MKKCSVCHEYKAVTDFFIKDSRKGKLHAQCKSCYAIKRRLYQEAHYKKYGDLYRKRAKARRIRVRQALHAKILDYLSDKGCIICDTKDPRVLDFDHIDAARKSFCISQGIRRGLDWSVILAEIQKCQILCANCHRIRTAAQFGWYRQ